MKGLPLLLGFVLCAHAADIIVQAGHINRLVKPGWLGVAFEEINHAGDGGILDELVRNGSFSEAATLDAWSAVESPGARVNLYFDTALPLSAAKVRSLRVEVDSSGGKSAGVSNEGYWGIPLVGGEPYSFSFYVRAAPGFHGTVTVALKAKGKVYASARIADPGPAWRKVSEVLRPDATCPAARLEITSNETGTFWLNLVSLRPAGSLFRPDLLRMVRAIKPGFMRFPGGTFVQGNDQASAFRWKRTLGPLEDRPGHKNLPWVYWSTDNLGFLEYLVLCEKLGATPVYVAYAGMSWTPDIRSPFGVLHQHRIPVNDVPLDEMGPVVQDVLDAIDYANGPITSQWGVRRAMDGHPAPFGLRYVEVGNEDDRAPLYQERYRLIRDAIKRRYPDIQVIADSHRDNPQRLKADLIDQHAYPSPMEALALADWVDARQAKGSKVVLGECATQIAAGYGNLRSALCDAVVLSAVERNTDLVRMVSYAPLLANVHAVNWKPNLIYFDGTRAWGTPSYYVETMFADSPLADVVPIGVAGPRLSVSMDGGISTRPFDARVDLADERTRETGGVIEYHVRVRKLGGEGGVAVRIGQGVGGANVVWWVGVKRRGGLLVWPMGGPQDVPVLSLETTLGGPLVPQVDGSLEKGRWYRIAVRVEGNLVQCFLDGTLIQESKVPADLGPSLYLSAGHSKQEAIVLRVVNIAAKAQILNIALNGVMSKHYQLIAKTLGDLPLDDENSLRAPKRIVPVTLEPAVVGAHFKWPVRAHSFEILTLTATTPTSAD